MSIYDLWPLIHMPHFAGVAPGYQWVLLLRIGVGVAGMLGGSLLVTLGITGVIYER